MAIIPNLGEIAAQFTNGYKSTQAQKQSQDLAAQQAQYEHAGRLFQMADQVQDPKMKDTLFSSATQIMDGLNKPQKKDPKGIGAMLGSLFGIGHHAAPATDTAATDTAAVPAVPGSAPAAVSPGSQTFGSLGDSFGDALKTTAPTETTGAQDASALPAVPNVDMSGVPPAKELQSAGLPTHIPTISDPRGTPIAAPLTAQMPALQTVATETPAGTAPQPSTVGALHPDAGKPLSIPSPIDITQAAMKATQSPQFGFRDPVKQKMAEQQQASQVMDTLLKVTDQHLASNPNIKTLADADNDPNFGPEFRQVMDAIGRYEAAGQIEKGTLENWQKQRFADVRFGSEKYNPNAAEQIVEDAYGNRWKKGPDGSFSVRATPGDLKTEPGPKFDERVDLAFSKPSAARTPADINMIAGYKEKFKTELAAKGTPTDRVQDAWLDDPKNTTGKTSDKIAESFQNRFHPLPPVPASLTPGISPTTNRSEIFVVNHATGKAESTGIRTAGQAFIPERYQKEVPVMTPVPGRPDLPAFDSGQKNQVFSADKLIAAHSSGDQSVSLDTINDLLNSGAEFTPADKEKLKKYAASQVNPYPGK